MRPELQASFGEPSPERVVHGAHPDDRRFGLAPFARDQGEGSALPPSEPPVRAHELLEGRDLVGLGVVQAVDEDVGAVSEAVGAAQVVGRVGPEVEQRVPPGHTIVPESPPPARTQDQGAVTIRADHHEADAGMVDERSDQARVQALDLLDREPVVALGQGDQPEAAGGERVLVWALVVLASVVLLVSMIANWVQTQVLDSSEFANSTDEILQNKDVQEQLSIFAVDQLYANVNVQAQIEQKLPPPAQPLAAPVTAATRQLAVNVAETALASPRVQDLVATAINGAQQRFVNLIEDKGQFVSTQGGVVTLEYGSLVAEVASRLGVDPSTISQIQGFIQQYSTELKQRLTTIQGKIESTRATLSQAQAGTLSPEAQQNLTTLETDAAQLHATVASLEQKITGILPKVPAQLQSRLSDLQARLTQLDKRLATVQAQAAAVLKDPSQANIIKLDPTLASLQTRVTDLLNRQAVQHPGELVVMKSSQLSGLQDLVKALRNLGFVLPLLALVLYLAAIYLAKGWRRETLIAVGGGIVAATLLTLLARRLLGSAIDSSTASSDAVKPAITAVWNIISGWAARAGAVRARDRAGLHRRRAARGARPPRGRRATLPGAVPARAAGRRLCGSRLHLPALADVASHDQQPRSGPRGPHSRRAGRGRASRSCAGRRHGSFRPAQLTTKLRGES